MLNNVILVLTLPPPGNHSLLTHGTSSKHIVRFPCVTNSAFLLQKNCATKALKMIALIMVNAQRYIRFEKQTYNNVLRFGFTTFHSQFFFT